MVFRACMARDGAYVCVSDGASLARQTRVPEQQQNCSDAGSPTVDMLPTPCPRGTDRHQLFLALALCHTVRLEDAAESLGGGTPASTSPPPAAARRQEIEVGSPLADWPEHLRHVKKLKAASPDEEALVAAAQLPEVSDGELCGCEMV